MSWNDRETPAELEARIRRQHEHAEQERLARQRREQELADRKSTYVPTKTLGEIHDPVERQNFIAQRRAEQKAKEAERVAGLMKDRAMRAYLDAGGTESGFEEAWPALQKRMLEDEAIKRMQG